MFHLLEEENMRGAHSCEETYKRPSAELTAAKCDSNFAKWDSKKNKHFAMKMAIR